MTKKKRVIIKPVVSTVSDTLSGDRLSQPKEFHGAREAQSLYLTTPQQELLSFLGLSPKLISGYIDSGGSWIDIIRKGLPKNVIDRIMEKLGFNEDQLASILHISKRTLQRRNPKDLLNPEQSERIIELAKLFSKGEEVFNDLPSFQDWMNDRIIALGNKKPTEYLDTSIGISILMDELGRIEHGIFS